MFEFFNKMCLYLNECNGSNTTRLFMMPLQQERPAEFNWTQEAGYMQDFLPCLTRQPVLHYSHPAVTGKVSPRARTGVHLQQSLFKHFS